MQSPYLGWQREEKTTYLLNLEKREEPFPLTAPTSVPASILEMLIFSANLVNDFGKRLLFSQEKREFKILDPCM